MARKVTELARSSSRASNDGRRDQAPGVRLVVGIGASAGGLEAFRHFFENTPPDTGMAFVLVQHLSPVHKSLLAELLDKSAAMDVIEADDGVAVKPNCVFVIPPDATMTIAGGHLEIVKPAPPRASRRPIDTFFRSLADDQGANAVGIVLSGTGSDGTLGTAAVREQGGLTLAQAEYDSHALPGMPHSAAASGQVDEVLKVEDMPRRLVAYQAHLAKIDRARDGNGAHKDAAEHMAAIMSALRVRSGHDFSKYKDKTLERRLTRRMQLLQVDSPADYVALIRSRPEELDELFRELLIGVTQFFRDPASFEALNDSLLKPLVGGKGADEAIRVWVPGCATGQEAYTIAILLREAMEARRPKPRVQIFGTDIDERAIDAARRGRYPRPVAGISSERLERWFTQEGEDSCVVQEIREMCVFSTHSLVKDPPFSRLDLISCRNLLIYLDPDLQDRVMRSFHYALKPGGHLFLGSSESATRAARLFRAADKKHRIFERLETDRAALPDLPARGPATGMAAATEAQPSAVADAVDRAARRVMEKHYPPHVVVDRRHQIVRFSGGAMGRYLEPTAGAPSFALFDILRKPLRPAVRAALQDAQTGNGPARRTGIPLRIGDKPRLVTILAETIAIPGDDAPCTVLAFQDTGAAASETDGTTRFGEAGEALHALEHELQTTRAQLQTSIDELEIANEELKSSNEEYQSVNEELQSSNEELETAKEEMQSVNEELQTVNAEMASKNDVLTHLNSDIKNLLESTEIATLFLDEQLRIKSFTNGVADIFSVRDTDIGRPITEIVGLSDYATLQADVRMVLRKLTVIERKVARNDGSMSFVLRIRPYRTIDNVIDGVVCTFVDMTEREAADAMLRESESQFHALADSIPQLAWIVDAEGEIFWFNRRWYEYTGTSRKDMQGGGWQGVHHPDQIDPMLARFKRCVAAGQPWEDTYQLRGADGEYRWFLSRAEPIRDSGGKIVRWFGTNTDVEEQNRSQQVRELVLRELDHRVKNLFAVVGGVVTISARSAATTAEMAGSIQGRIGALANAHKLIRAPEPGVAQLATLDELLQAVVAPYVNADSDAQDRVVLDGSDVAIGGGAVTSLALVLHELATNAAKHGALSQAGGRLAIAWSVENGSLALQWQERGGPAIAGPPKAKGFGSVLAERSVRGQLRGELVNDWDSKGLTVHLKVPLERLIV